MRPFALVEPESIEAASRRLVQGGESARVLAGGVDLLGELKDRLVEVDTIVNLKSIPGLRAIEAGADGSLRLGALATLTEVARHARVREEYAAVAEAAESVGSPEIRNVGTVGGNLCQRPRCWYYRSPHHPCLKKGGDVCYTIGGQSRYHAIFGGGPSFIVHPSDLAPALAACGARVEVGGPSGPKEMPLEQFYVLPEVRLDHETILQDGEIVTGVTLPAAAGRASGWRSLFLKFREKDSFDFALVSVAAAIRMEGTVCREGRVVLGGVAPVPWRSEPAEKAIAGRAIDEATARKAAEAALEGAEPLEHNAYKIPLAKTLLRRALMRLAGGAAA